jgi:alanine racemase
MSRASAEVNLLAVADNLRLIKSKTDAQVLAVVKADAYGHGLIQVSKAAVDAGADWLGTALLEEGITLRKSGIKIPIISWLTPLGEDFKTAIDLDVDLSISSVELLNEVVTAGKSVKKIPRVHIEVDTGMSRGGVGDDWQLFLDQLIKAAKSNEINVVGIWSHFARADEPDERTNKKQLATFEDRIKSLATAGISPEFIHIANSAASLTNKVAHKNIIRWGIG